VYPDSLYEKTVSQKNKLNKTRRQTATKLDNKFGIDTVVDSWCTIN